MLVEQPIMIEQDVEIPIPEQHSSLRWPAYRSMYHATWMAWLRLQMMMFYHVHIMPAAVPVPSFTLKTCATCMQCSVWVTPWGQT